MADIEVGLLIELNCPSSLCPREVAYNEESDPYAICLLLGWYVKLPPCNLIENGEGADYPKGS